MLTEEKSAAAVVAAPEPVTPFDDGQKARINELIKDAMGRAGGEAKAEVARLKAELDQLKSTASPEPDTTLRTRLAEVEHERDSLRSSQQEAALLQQIRDAAGNEWVDSSLAIRLLRDSVKVVDGKAVVVNDAGEPVLNSQLSPMTLSEAAAALAAQKPFLVRSTIKSGIGSTPAAVSAFSGEPVALSRLFGKGSDSQYANQFALKNPAEYRRLRAQALQKGLL